MDDDQRLRELVARGCARRGWGSEKTVSTLFYTSRLLMMRLGGFEGLCGAEGDDVRSWVRSKSAHPSTAYNYLRHMRDTFDFLVEEGVIGANPASGIKVAAPTRKDVRQKPPAELKDVRRVFSYARRRSDSVEGAKRYLVLCLKVRCGVRYSSIARCRVGNLVPREGCGALLAPFVGTTPETQVLYRVDDETSWAFENYLKARGPVSEDDPLVAKSNGGFYKDASLERFVHDLFCECGLKASDFDLGKTMVELAYAEGANVVQASTFANGGLTLAVKVAEELPFADLGELHRKLVENLDSDEDMASGRMAAEDIMAAVLPAFKTPFLKVVIGADGWARFELPDGGETSSESSGKGA